VNRRQNKAIACLGAVTGFALYRTLRRHTHSSAPQATTAVTAPQPEESHKPNSTEHPPIETASRLRAVINWSLQLLAIIVSIALTFPFVFPLIYEYFLPSFRYGGLAARLALLAGMGLAAFMLIRRNTIPVIKVMFGLLLLAQFFLLAARTTETMEASANPVALLEATAFGVLGLGIVLSVVAAWCRRWSLIEPFAVSILAISLGVLCLPGLNVATSPLGYPDVKGAALLFATGPKNDGVLLSVTTDPLNPYNFETGSSSEGFRIKNRGSRRIHWVLLLTGDARLYVSRSENFTRSKDLDYDGKLSMPSVILPEPIESSVYIQPLSGPAQLFSGILRSKSTASMAGITASASTSSTADRTAVSLPEYGEGNLKIFNTSVKRRIITLLSASPNTRAPDNFTVNVFGGNLDPSQTVTLSNPNDGSGPSDSPKLAWTSHSNILPTYTVTDQNQADLVSDLLFVFAILIAAAVAGLLTGVQILIHILSSPDHKAENKA